MDGLLEVLPDIRVTWHDRFLLGRLGGRRFDGGLRFESGVLLRGGWLGIITRSLDNDEKDSGRNRKISAFFMPLNSYHSHGTGGKGKQPRALLARFPYRNEVTSNGVGGLRTCRGCGLNCTPASDLEACLAAWAATSVDPCHMSAEWAGPAEPDPVQMTADK